jgi:hypothetical protein
MSENAVKAQSSLNTAYQSIKAILEKARSTAYRAVNFAMVQAYWRSAESSLNKSKKEPRGQNMVLH